MRRGQLPILNPCQEDYGAMRGPAQRRFCDKCDKHVHNLSEMTEREATALLGAQDGARICVRYRVASDGRVRFRPEARRAGFVALISFAMAACTGYAEPDTLESPDAAMVCRDASGYAVDCELAHVETIPDAEPEVTPVPQPEAQPEPEPEPVEEYELMGDIAYEPLPPEKSVEPCPLPAHPIEGSAEIMGEMLPETPRSRRAARRQRRADRRAERRRKRRGDEDLELMGVVLPDDP